MQSHYLNDNDCRHDAPSLFRCAGFVVFVGEHQKKLGNNQSALPPQPRWDMEAEKEVSTEENEVARVGGGGGEILTTAMTATMATVTAAIVMEVAVAV